MSYHYKEYPIRCKTCNEEIACFAPEYEALISTGISAEDALNQLNIRNFCSRIAMMSPTIIFHVLQNDEVVNGDIDVRNVSDVKKSIIPYDDEGGITLGYEASKAKIYPNVVGKTTINPDPEFSNKEVLVGYDGFKNLYTEILSGQVYLAR